MLSTTFLRATLILTLIILAEATNAQGTCNLPLPCQNSVSSSQTALSITNTGTAPAGLFKINNSTSISAALWVQTNGTNGLLVHRFQEGPFNFPLSQEKIALRAVNSRVDGVAGIFRNNHPSNSESALEALTTGSGLAFRASNRLPDSTTPNSTTVHIIGTDNNGQTAPLKISSGSQNMFLDGNEIDAQTSLYLNHNSNAKVILATGGGNVGVGESNPGKTLDGHQFHRLPEPLRLRRHPGRARQAG